MSRGRLPSLFLLSTEPMGGIWFPPRAVDQANRERTWQVVDGRVVWSPAPPPDAEKKVEFLTRAASTVASYRAQGTEAFLKLSGTTKTGVTWSLPAVGSCPVIDETCGRCYALDGFYRTNVAAQVGRVMRLEYLKQLISNGDLEPWISWATFSIQRLRPEEVVPAAVRLDSQELSFAKSSAVSFFRWHDSGDVFHTAYARAVIEVCRRTPATLHWLPTRMGRMFASLVASGVRLPVNLAVQVSCHRGGRIEAEQLAAVSQIRALQPTARVGVTYAHAGAKSRGLRKEDVWEAFGAKASLCPATIADKSADRVCKGCRRCWSSADLTFPIIYAVHTGN
jgi:hypothetical protein